MHPLAHASGTQYKQAKEKQWKSKVKKDVKNRFFSNCCNKHWPYEILCNAGWAHGFQHGEKSRVFSTFTVIDNFELIPSNTAFSWVISHANYREFCQEFTLDNTEFTANYLKSVNHKFISHYPTGYTGIIFTKKTRSYSLLNTQVFLKIILSYLRIITSNITSENSN